MLGGFLALISAATFGLNNAVARRGVLTGTVAQAMAISIPLGMVMFAIAVPMFSAWDAFLGFDAAAYALLAIAGVVHFVGNRYCTTRATKAMGGNLVGPFQQVSLLWTLALAIFFLGEALTPVKIAGIVLILAGPLVLFGRRKAPGGVAAAPAVETKAPSAKPVFVPNYREGYTFAVLSAVFSGTSPILIRMAMPENSGIAAGIAAATVSYIAATVVIGFVLVLPGRFSHARSVTPENAVLFSISGVLVNLSQLFRYMALAIAPVSVVTPIQRTAVVFRLIFARMINPDHELFTPRVLIASGLSLIGALVLTLSL